MIWVQRLEWALAAMHLVFVALTAFGGFLILNWLG
jgi:hypothetical protein